MSGRLSPSRREVRETVQELRRHGGLFSFRSDVPASESVSRNSISPELGVRPGGIVECLVARQGAGAFTSAMQIMAKSSAGRGFLAVVDPAREFYVPASIRVGRRSEQSAAPPPGRLERKRAGRSRNACGVPVSRLRGPGSTSEFPHGFIAAGNWQRKPAEEWVCFSDQSQRDESPFGPSYDCWSHHRLEPRRKPDD